MSEARRRDISGPLFVAFMFLGMGIGFLFDKVAPGLFIGMGLGFFAMAVARALMREPVGEESKKDHPDEGGFIGTLILILIGVGFIFGGLSLIFGISIPWRILGGVFIMLLGLWFLLKALGKVD